MKTLNNITSSILLLTLLTTSCQNESIPQDCNGDNTQLLETFYSDEFEGIQCSLQNVENDQKEVNLVITNQTSLEKYLSCSTQLPSIDFDKYFILAGVYRHHQCALFDSQQVSVCNNKIIYKVRMLEQICQAAMPVFYITVIEKKYSNLPVEFDVQFKD